MEIDRTAAGGDGVGREPSGRVVFVPRTAPGDRVLAEILEERRRWARGRAVEWIARGPERREAPCPLYARCGGCRLQHLSLRVQRNAKRDLVRETLQRIGRVAVDVPEPIVAGGDLGYRNRVTFTLRRDRGAVKAGYRDFEEPGRLVDVEDCPLAEPAVREVWRAVRRYWEKDPSVLPDGAELRLTVRGSVERAVDLLVEGREAGDGAAVASLEAAVPGLVGCHLRKGESMVPLCGRETLPDRWQGLHFDLPPAVFLQVNREVSERMDRWLDQRVGDVSGRRILDLYCGVGARAIRWSLFGARVTGCEMSGPACRAAAGAAERAGAKVKLVADRVERCLPDLLPADVVVVNPPRGGLAPSVARRLAAGGAQGLAYVSCDPATLARDVERLAAGWRVREVQPFDAFPHTAHVETVVWLEPIGGGAIHA